MQVGREEYRVNRGMVIGGLICILFGLIFGGMGLEHVISGEPLMITNHQALESRPATSLELVGQILFGLVAIATGVLWLLWCARGAILLEPEGIAVRNLFGRIVRRIRWEEVTGVKLSNYQGRHYFVRTAGRSVRLQSYRNIDQLAAEIARRSPNIQATDLLG